jgi:cyclic pyranopterin phosphate synthase
MGCIYCPPFGENLCHGNSPYDINAAKTLIKLAKQNRFQTVRFTGGEPLLFPEILQELLDECDNEFQRLVLNTNGTLLHKYFELLEKYKNNFILKISFDSIVPTEFNDLTKTSDFNTVFENINTALAMGFQVEINSVLVNQ